MFDTGSGWLVLETSDCADCVDTYDYRSNADTFSNLPNSTISQVYADGTTIEGNRAMDWVCPDWYMDSCSTDFVFMNIITTGLPADLNGILGLCANSSATGSSLTVEDFTPTSYITALYLDGVIDHQIFAFALFDQMDTDSSFMDVGFYNEAAMNDPDDLVWIPVVDDEFYGTYWWHNYVTGIRFRN